MTSWGISCKRSDPETFWVLITIHYANLSLGVARHIIKNTKQLPCYKKCCVMPLLRCVLSYHVTVTPRTLLLADNCLLK